MCKTAVSLHIDILDNFPILTLLNGHVLKDYCHRKLFGILKEKAYSH